MEHEIVWNCHRFVELLRITLLSMLTTDTEDVEAAFSNVLKLRRNAMKMRPKFMIFCVLSSYNFIFVDRSSSFIF